MTPRSNRIATDRNFEGHSVTGIGWAPGCMAALVAALHIYNIFRIHRWWEDGME